MRYVLLVVLALSVAGCRGPAGNAADSSKDVDSPPPASAAAGPEPTEAGPKESATVRADTPARIVLSPEGLVLAGPSGAPRTLRFGEPADAVIAAVAAIRGVTPELMRNDECGAGPLDMAHWPDSLTLVSQDARFVGWSVDARGTASTAPPLTGAGIGIGSTRADLLAAHAATVHESTLGEEFDAGGVFGVLDGPRADSRIDALWGGTSCNFR